MNVNPTYVTGAIGVMNSRPIMRYGFAIDVMHFIVVIVMKWINVMIVVKLFVDPAPHSLVVNFVVADYVKNVPPLVDGTYIMQSLICCRC